MAATQQAPPSESMIDSMLFCCSPRGRREEPSNLFVSEMMFYRKAEEVKEWKPSRPTSNAEKLKVRALGLCTYARRGLCPRRATRPRPLSSLSRLRSSTLSSSRAPKGTWWDLGRASSTRCGRESRRCTRDQLRAIPTVRPRAPEQVDRAKWDAWKLLEEKSKEEAMTEYVDEADRQMAEFS
jgi:hypothetical protein